MNAGKVCTHLILRVGRVCRADTQDPGSQRRQEDEYAYDYYQDEAKNTRWSYGREG